MELVELVELVELMELMELMELLELVELVEFVPQKDLHKGSWGGWSNPFLCHSQLELRLSWAVTIFLNFRLKLV